MLDHDISGRSDHGKNSFTDATAKHMFSLWLLELRCPNAVIIIMIIIFVY